MSDLFERLTGLTLRDPGFLLLALLILPALWLARRRGAPAIRFAPAAFVNPRAEHEAGGAPPAPGGATGKMPGSWRTRLLPLPRLLQVAGVLSAVIALARPAARESLPTSAEGIDILLCLDTSSSMTANDMDRRRTRLEVARAAAEEFIGRRPGDRIGLLTFARYADVLCPPTLDHEALAKIVSGVTPVASDGPEDATGIGGAAARAAQVLAEGPTRSRVAVLLTDGAENVALPGAPKEIAPSHAAQLCQKLGVRVYAIVVGQDPSGGAGSGASSDQFPIRQLAEKTGGTYEEARNASAVTSVYAKIDALERIPVEAPLRVFADRFLPFLIAAAALLLLARLLSSSLLAVLP